jgi:hypothetical protein
MRAFQALVTGSIPVTRFGITSRCSLEHFVFFIGGFQMAKQLKWGSFGIEDLRVDEEDDIFKGFPFLKLEGFEMILKTMLTITMNLVRGIYGTDDTKITGLSGSLPYGWDRTSLPIPFIFNATQGILEIFDRRHTLNVLNSINSIDEVPGARYSRIFPDGYDLINSFSTKSILTMAGVWGNVFGPIKDDAKDHHFVAAALDIFKREDITPERDHVYEVIKWMGVNERYNFNKSVVSRIVTDIMSEYDDPNTVANKVSYDTDKNSIDSFIAESKEWQPNDTVTDTTVYIVKAIEDNSGFLAKYADDITRKICEVEKEHGQEKLIKVLLYNQTNKQSKKIAKARKVFREKITTQWELRRNNVLKPIESILNPEIITKKKLSDFNLEIWFKDQIEGEDAPFQMRLD